MKLLYTLLITLITLISCKNSNNKNLASCKKKDLILKDTTFYNSEILSSTYYNDKCKINRLKLFVLLDDRSGNLKSVKNLTDIVLKLGFYPDSLINLVIPKKEALIFQKNTHSILQIEYSFKTPFLDSINLIDLKTISFEKSGNKGKILKSNSYFYNESKSILGIENTYLDYSAFIKTRTQFKNISKSKSKIDSILITVKPNKNVDDITKYNIVLNDTLILNFKNSIHANYRNRKTKDKNILMYNLLKNNNYFTSFKLNLSALNLHKITSVEVTLK